MVGLVDRRWDALGEQQSLGIFHRREQLLPCEGQGQVAICPQACYSCLRIGQGSEEDEDMWSVRATAHDVVTQPLIASHTQEEWLKVDDHAVLGRLQETESLRSSARFLGVVAFEFKNLLHHPAQSRVEMHDQDRGAMPHAPLAAVHFSPLRSAHYVYWPACLFRDSPAGRRS